MTKCLWSMPELKSLHKQAELHTSKITANRKYLIPWEVTALLGRKWWLLLLLLLLLFGIQLLCWKMEFWDNQNNLQIEIDKLKHWNAEIKHIHFKVMSLLQKLSVFILKEFFKRSFTLPWRITPSNPDFPVQSVNWKINYLHSTGFREKGPKRRQAHTKVSGESSGEWERINMEFIHRTDTALWKADCYS